MILMSDSPISPDMKNLVKSVKIYAVYVENGRYILYYINDDASCIWGMPRKVPYLLPRANRGQGQLRHNVA